MKIHNQKGFTLIELLIVIALIAVLAGAVIIALNPARQFQLSRNSERWSHVSAIVEAITSNTTENKGVWTCDTFPATLFATGTTYVIEKSGVNAADICGCIVPSQMATLPVDPTTGKFTDCSTYSSGYNISKNNDGRITVTAPNAEASVSSTAIAVTQ